MLEAIERCAFGFTLFAAAAASHHTPPTPETDREQFPALAAALDAAPSDEETVYVEALRVILDGLRTRYGRNQDRTRKRGDANGAAPASSGRGNLRT